MKKNLFFIFFSPFIFAQAPAGYYFGTENLKGYELKNKLTTIIQKGSITRNYGDLVSKYYQYTDLDKYYDHGEENTTYLLDIYTEVIDGPEVEYTINSVVSGAKEEGMGINREHMVPQSTFDGLYPMFSDLYTVIPADAHINGKRSNYPYGVVGNNVINTFKNGGKLGKGNIQGHSYTGNVFEPIDEFKGDVARSLLYYVVRYAQKLPFLKHNYFMSGHGDVNPMDGSVDRGFDAAYINMLKQWHELDPVSKREIDRNNAVYKIQGNRNPFVDNPEWVNIIWNDETDGSAPNPPQNIQSNMGAHFAKITWDAPSNSKVLGYKVYLGSNLEVITHQNEAYIDRLTPNTEYTFKVVSYDGDFIDSQEIIINGQTLEQDQFSSDLIISKYIEGTGNNKAIEIANRTGHPVNLNNYRFASLSSSNTYLEEYIDLEGVLEHNETMVIMHPESTLSCLNHKDANLLTDIPSFRFNGKQYVQLSHTDKIVDVIGGYKEDNSDIMKDVSLYRNLDDVLHPTLKFDKSEWISYNSDYCEGLQQSLSTAKNLVKNHIKIYPNPTAEFFYVGKDLAKEILIFDMSGKNVLKINNVKKGETVKVEHLPSGHYFVLIDGQSQKLIKK